MYCGSSLRTPSILTSGARKSAAQRATSLHRGLQRQITDECRLRHFHLHCNAAPSGELGSANSEQASLDDEAQIVDAGVRTNVREYWIDFDNVANDLLAAMRKHDHPQDTAPSYGKLQEWGEHMLARGLQYHGGRVGVAHKLGLKLQKKGQGYWQVEGNVESELSDWRLRHGVPEHEMPTMIELNATGCSTLRVAIARYHGGWRKFAGARRLTLRTNVDSDVLQQHPPAPQRMAKGKPWGYWTVLANVEREFWSFMREQDMPPGVMPTHMDLMSGGAHNLRKALRQHFGGLAGATTHFGLSCRKVPRPACFWHDLNNVKQELLPYTVLAQDDIRVLPSKSMLIDAGRHDIMNSITFHGGVKTVAQHFGWRTWQQHKSSSGVQSDGP